MSQKEKIGFIYNSHQLKHIDINTIKLATFYVKVLL